MSTYSYPTLKYFFSNTWVKWFCVSNMFFCVFAVQCHVSDVMYFICNDLPVSLFGVYSQSRMTLIKLSVWSSVSRNLINDNDHEHWINDHLNLFIQCFSLLCPIRKFRKIYGYKFVRLTEISYNFNYSKQRSLLKLYKLHEYFLGVLTLLERF